MSILLETIYGDIVIDLDIPNENTNDDDTNDNDIDKKTQQRHQIQIELCNNFLKLVYSRYYTNTLIYQIIPNHFCSIGCPIGNGTGGSCIYGYIDTVLNQQQQQEQQEQQQQEEQEQSNTATTTTTTIIDYKLSKKRFLKSTNKDGRSLYTLTKDICQEKGRVYATCINYPNYDTSISDTIGSQFIITTSGSSSNNTNTNNTNHALDGYYNYNDSTAIENTLLVPLGMVVEDTNHVLEKINTAYIDGNGRPYADIRIIRALVIYDPYSTIPIVGLDILLRSRGIIVDNNNNDDVNDENCTNRRIIDSPSPVRPDEESVPKRISAQEIINNEYATNTTTSLMDDEIYEQERMKQLRIQQEETAKKVDYSRAVVLEMIGDLPDANIRVPENVLFICQLNPITQDDDLLLIFSRFDPNVTVDIIRDPITKQSLQYGFITFTNKYAATEAYFKMNHILIDDRRIKVDFSQSVAKLWNKYTQKMIMPQLDNMNHTTSNNTNNNKNNTYSDKNNRTVRGGRDISKNRGSYPNNNNRHHQNTYDHRRPKEHDQRREEGKYGTTKSNNGNNNRKDDSSSPNEINRHRYERSNRGEYNSSKEDFHHNRTDRYLDYDNRNRDISNQRHVKEHNKHTSYERLRNDTTENDNNQRHSDSQYSIKRDDRYNDQNRSMRRSPNDVDDDDDDASRRSERRERRHKKHHREHKHKHRRRRHHHDSDDHRYNDSSEDDDNSRHKKHRRRERKHSHRRYDSDSDDSQQSRQRHSKSHRSRRDEESNTKADSNKRHRHDTPREKHRDRDETDQRRDHSKGNHDGKS